MKIHKRMMMILVLLTSLLLVIAALASPAATTLERYVIGGGGGQIQAGSYTLEGTIGQAVVGMDSSPHISLCSGFWCMESSTSIYLPIISRRE